MSRNLIVKAAAIGFFLLFAIVGCDWFEEDDDEDNHGFYCPQCNETVTWSSYGNVVIGDFGSDSYGWKLESDCGWKIYEGHRGGYGDTLELYSCGEENNPGVIFIWAWQSLHGFHLSQGWTGQTSEGIKIGDSLDEFFYHYPDFYWDYEIGDQVCYGHDNSDGYQDVWAIFENEILIKLKVDWP